MDVCMNICMDVCMYVCMDVPASHMGMYIYVGVSLYRCNTFHYIHYIHQNTLHLITLHYIRNYIHTWLTYIHTFMHACMHACIRKPVYTCKRKLCRYACLHVYMHAYVRDTFAPTPITGLSACAYPAMHVCLLLLSSVLLTDGGNSLDRCRYSLLTMGCSQRCTCVSCIWLYPNPKA